MKGLNEDDKKLADSVVATVLDYTNLSYDDFVYRRSLRTAVSARRVVSLILRDYGWSYPKIGEAIQKDHASVYNLVNRASFIILRLTIVGVTMLLVKTHLLKCSLMLNTRMKR
jgi:chromosomal replication initiation ATPase DnaA